MNLGSNSASNSADSKAPGAQTLPPAPANLDSKVTQNRTPEILPNFGAKWSPPGTQWAPKMSPNLQKVSPRRLQRGSVNPVRKKLPPRACPRMPIFLPYSKYHGSSASRKVPAGTILSPFWLHLGASWTPWVPKGRQSAEKSAFQKHMKKRLQKTCPKSPK